MRERQRAGGCGHTITAIAPGFHYKIKEICDLWYNDLGKQKEGRKAAHKRCVNSAFRK